MKRGILLTLAVLVLGAVLWFAWRPRDGPRTEPPPSPGMISDKQRSGRHNPLPLAAADLRLAGLRLGMSGAEVRAILGRPAKVTLRTEPSFHNPDWTTYWETWRYPGIEATFMNSAPGDRPRPAGPGVVLALTAKDGTYRTHRGVRVGDPAALVKTRYGRPEEEEGRFYYYEGDSAYLTFTVARGVVTEVSVGSLID
ncbi:MAG: hypothetical protein ACM3XS_05105 [Bacteroidota bacterium]